MGPELLAVLEMGMIECLIAELAIITPCILIKGIMIIIVHNTIIHILLDIIIMRSNGTLSLFEKNGMSDGDHVVGIVHLLLPPPPLRIIG